MAYKELSRREETEVKEYKTVFTTVEIDLEDGSKKTIEIPHFCPDGEDDIKRGIENRIISENRKLSDNQ